MKRLVALFALALLADVAPAACPCEPVECTIGSYNVRMGGARREVDVETNDSWGERRDWLCRFVNFGSPQSRF